MTNTEQPGLDAGDVKDIVLETAHRIVVAHIDWDAGDDHETVADITKRLNEMLAALPKPTDEERIRQYLVEKSMIREGEIVADKVIGFLKHYQQIIDAYSKLAGKKPTDEFARALEWAADYMEENAQEEDESSVKIWADHLREVASGQRALSPAPDTVGVPGDALTHEWVKSTLGHGESMCKHCRMTNREAAVLGELNTPCEKRPALAGAMLPHAGAYDDTDPVMAALLHLTDDQHATDRQRATARVAMSEILRLRALLASPLQLDEDRSFAASIEALRSLLVMPDGKLEPVPAHIPDDHFYHPGPFATARHYRRAHEVLSALSKRADSERKPVNTRGAALGGRDPVDDLIQRPDEHPHRRYIETGE